MPTLTPEKIAAILQCYDELKSYKKVAEKLGVKPHTVSLHVRKAKASANISSLNVDSVKKEKSEQTLAYEKYFSKVSPIEVAIDLGIDDTKALEYHSQYMRLTGRSFFVRIYDEVRYSGLLKINRFLIETEKLGLSAKEIATKASVLLRDVPNIKTNLEAMSRENIQLKRNLAFKREKLLEIERRLQNEQLMLSKVCQQRDVLEHELVLLHKTKQQFLGVMFNPVPSELSLPRLPPLEDENRKGSPSNDEKGSFATHS